MIRERDLNKAVLSGGFGRTLPREFTDFLLNEMKERSDNERLRNTFYRNFDKLTMVENSYTKGRKFLYFSDLFEIAQSFGYSTVGKLLEDYGASIQKVDQIEEETDRSKLVFVPQFDNNAMRDFNTNHFLYSDPGLTGKDGKYYKKSTAIQTMYQYLSDHTLSETKWCCDMLYLLGCCQWIKDADATCSPSAKIWRCMEAKISIPLEYKSGEEFDQKADWLKTKSKHNIKNARSPFNMNEIINICNGYNISYRWVLSTWSDDVFYGFDPYAEGAFDIFTLLDQERQNNIVEKILS